MDIQTSGSCSESSEGVTMGGERAMCFCAPPMDREKYNKNVRAAVVAWYAGWTVGHTVMAKSEWISRVARVLRQLPTARPKRLAANTQRWTQYDEIRFGLDQGCTTMFYNIIIINNLLRCRSQGLAWTDIQRTTA